MVWFDNWFNIFKFIGHQNYKMWHMNIKNVAGMVIWNIQYSKFLAHFCHLRQWEYCFTVIITPVSFPMGRHWPESWTDGSISCSMPGRVCYSELIQLCYTYFSHWLCLIFPHLTLCNKCSWRNKKGWIDYKAYSRYFKACSPVWTCSFPSTCIWRDGHLDLGLLSTWIAVEDLMKLLQKEACVTGFITFVLIWHKFKLKITSTRIK
jgi:hypothetical protein